MSKFSEIQNQYKGFEAALEAVNKTEPGKVEVVYKNSKNNHDGFFVYDPREKCIGIWPRRYIPSDYVRIRADDVPALIKALRDFFE